MLELSAFSPLQNLLAARPTLAIRVLVATLASLILVATGWAAVAQALLVVPGTARVRPNHGPVRGFLDDLGILAVAPFSGRLAEVWVGDGQKVDAGTPLFRLETDSLEENLSRAEAQILVLQQELSLVEQAERQTQALLEASLARLEAEMLAAGAETLTSNTENLAAVRLGEIALVEAQAEVTRLGPLLELGAASQVELERARAAVAKAEQELLRSRGTKVFDRRLVLERQREELSQQTALERTRLANQRLDLVRALEEQHQAQKSARRDLGRAVVKAEAAGIVTVVQRPAAKDSVAAGAVIVTLTPSGPLRIDAAIPAAEIEEVRLGAPARVILAGRELGPKQVVRGQVSYLGADSEFLADTGTHVYLVSIQPESLGGLKIGMTGKVEVEVGRQSLLSLAFIRLRHQLSLD